MFKVAKIGIEFEFDIPWRIERVLPFAKAFVNSYNEIDNRFIIEVDREYYAQQIEFKLKATENIREGIAHFHSFIKSCYLHFNDISCVGNPFVGTHVHLFLEKDWQPYELMARWKKLPIFDYVYSKFTEFLAQNTHWLNRKIISLEARRLAYNHNILRHFDRKYLKDWIRKNLEDIDYCYPMFHTWINRPKYQPCIWSLANLTTWKPHSFEIRAIPNSWFLTSTTGEISEFICQIEKLFNKRHNPRHDYVSSIIKTNKRLLGICQAI